jgi:hypothetical protein
VIHSLGDALLVVQVDVKPTGEKYKDLKDPFPDFKHVGKYIYFYLTASGDVVEKAFPGAAKSPWDWRLQQQKVGGRVYPEVYYAAALRDDSNSMLQRLNNQYGYYMLAHKCYFSEAEDVIGLIKSGALLGDVFPDLYTLLDVFSDDLVRFAHFPLSAFR